MVAENGIGKEMRHQLVRTLRKAGQHLGACGRVIDRHIPAFEAQLEIDAVFAEVVEQTGEEGRAFEAQRFGHFGGKDGDAEAMLREQLPVHLALVCRAMRVPGHDHPHNQ
jgi:hypothetical protein